MSSSSHLKRYPAPKSWIIERKVCDHITKPAPGAHTLDFSVTIGQLLKQMKIAKTLKEVKYILRTHKVLVDGKRIKSYDFCVGFMDVVSISAINVLVRIIFDTHRRIITKPIQKVNSTKKPLKIIGKNLLKKNKMQLNLMGGRSVICDFSKYSLNDSVMIELPKQKIIEYLPMKNGAYIFLIGGSHSGKVGVVEEVKESMIMYKIKNQSFETHKSCVYIIPENMAKELKL